jgi:hypothetical protein
MEIDSGQGMTSTTDVSKISRLSLVLNGLLIVCVLLLAAATPPAQGAVAVFAAPWSTQAADIVVGAGGRLVANGRWPWIILAISDDSDFVPRLYRAGAMLVTDSRLAIGCHAGERLQDLP